MAYAFYAAAICARRTGFVACLPFAMAIGSISATAPALAETTAPPGSIIISRDVPLRPAHIPKDPGQVNAVQASPAGVVLGAVGQMGTPLSDSEAAAISANSYSAGHVGPDNSAAPDQTLLNSMASSDSSSLGQTSAAGGMIGSAINSGLGAIGTGMSALNSALSNISTGVPNQ